MDSANPSLRELARKLLAIEGATTPPSDSAADAREHVAVRVCEKLRISVTQFAGAAGFAALMRRTMALTRAEVPLLNSVTVKPDCSMEEFEALASEERDGGVEAMATLIAHLLGLLVTFIGEPLTLRLVRESWPDASLE